MNHRDSMIECRRCLDGLIYRFAPAGTRNDRPRWRRVDIELYLEWTARVGWSINDAVGTVLGRPWDVERDEQEALPPDGIWVSRKGPKSYVYEHRYVALEQST